MIATYAVMTVLALLLLLGYSFFVQKKERWLLFLYICVAVVNIGYLLLSISTTLEVALFANKVAYLGSVFLSTCMLMTIIKLCGFQYKKALPISLIVVGIAMFAIISTTGFLPWYYKEVSLVYVDGAAKLKKVYGVLHPTYLVYLLLYFGAMIGCIFISRKKKLLASRKHAALMTAIVFGNILVWFVEKFIPWDFEFLSISYLFSEIVFLGLYWMMDDYVRIDSISVTQSEIKALPIDLATMPTEEKILAVLSHLPDGNQIHPREREILEAILENKKRKGIASDMNLSENTIKTYTRTLYSKLGVSSREELFNLIQSNQA